MYITLCFIVTCLPDSLSAVMDLFLAMDPTDLTVDLLEKHILAAEASIVAVGAAHGTPRTPFFGRLGVDIFAIHYDAILVAMYALTVSVEGDCYLCVPPDPCIEAAALGASESALPGTASAEALHTFMLDSGASCYFFCESTTVTPLHASVAVTLVDPSEGPVLACSSTVLPCPAVPSGSLSGLHLPSFSMNLVSTAAFHDAMVTTTTPGGQRVSICTCTRTGRHLATFTHRPGSSLYTLTTEPPHIAASGQGCERYFLLVVDDYSRYTTVFPLRSKGEVPDVLIPWIRNVRLQLRERFREDLPVLHLHSDRGGEFSSDLLRDFCRGEGIRQSFSLPASPQQNGVAKHRIGFVMEPRVSLPETSPTLRWTGEVGDASVFRDVMFDESVPYYRLFPYRIAPLPPLPLFLAPGPPPVDPLTPKGPAPSGVSQVDPLPLAEPVEVAIDSGAAGGGAARGVASGGAEPERAELGVAEPEVAEFEGAEPGGAEPERAELGGAEFGVAEPWGAEPEGAKPGDTESGGAEPGGTLSAGGPAAAGPGGAGAACPGGARTRGTGAAGAGGTASAGAREVLELLVPEVLVLEVLELLELVVLQALELETLELEALELEVPEVLELLVLEVLGAAGPGGALTGGTGASGAGGAAGARAGDPETGDPGAGGARPGGVGAVGTGAGGTVRTRSFFVPLLCKVLSLPSSTGLTPPLLCPPPDQSQPQLQLDSPLPAPSPHNEQTDNLTQRRAPESRPALPVRAIRTGRRVPCPRPPPVPGTHVMALRPSSVPLQVALPSPPASSLPDVSDPESDLVRAASPTVTCLLATIVTDPSFESTTLSALVAELVDFAAACCLDYAASLVAESECVCPQSVGGEFALGMDVLEDTQEDFECLAATIPHLVAMLLGHEVDPDAPDIPTPCSYTEAITGPYSSVWETAMDAEMAFWKSTSTYIVAVPPPGAKIVDGMWIFKVKRPPGSPPVFKARYVARRFGQRQGVDFFQNFSLTPKMTTLRVLLHVAAQHDYELHSLDFSTAFL
ncbi:unnamed protein product [Closterium sp. NIES-54]